MNVILIEKPWIPACTGMTRIGNRQSINRIGIISRLKKHANISEVHHKTSFHCYRTDKNGNSQKVYVDIFDEGPDVNRFRRYSCQAKTEDGKMGFGNPASSIGEVLNKFNWDGLDR